MVFSEEDKVVINVLRQEKGHIVKKFINKFLKRNWYP